MFLVDILLIALTSTCIWYCYSLTLKIKSLQENREEFLKIIKYFDTVISKADESVNNLNELSEKANVKLADNISKAQTLSEDLVFMNEIGSELAEKIEKNIAAIRSEKSSVDTLSGKNFSDNENENINPNKGSARLDKNDKLFDDSSFADSVSYSSDLGSVGIPSISTKNLASDRDGSGNDYYSTLRKLNKKL
jgi:hypothetical protein